MGVFGRVLWGEGSKEGKLVGMRERKLLYLEGRERRMEEEDEGGIVMVV